MSDIKDFDSFWLEKGQTLVNDTFTNLNKHLKNYSTYLKTLIGFYTFLGLTSSLITASTNIKVYLIFILPYIILLLAQFKVSSGQKVHLEVLDLRSPLQINEAYGKLVKGLQHDVISAKRWVALATFAILVGGTLAFYFLNLEKAEKEKLDKIEARAEKILGFEDEALKDFVKTQKLKVSKVKGENKIIVEAKFPKEEIIEIIMITAKDDDTITKSIKVTKLCDFKLDLEDAKQLLSAKIK